MDTGMKLRPNVANCRHCGASGDLVQSEESETAVDDRPRIKRVELFEEADSPGARAHATTPTSSVAARREVECGGSNM